MRKLLATLLVTAGALACGEGKPPIALAAAPAEWSVMAFPRRAIAVDGPDGRPVAIDRAIVVSVADLRAGSTAVDVGGGATAPVDLAQLYFLPGSEGDRQIEAWRKTLPSRGVTGGSWAAAASDGGRYRIELRLHADGGREDMRVYLATRDRIESFEAAAP